MPHIMSTSESTLESTWVEVDIHGVDSSRAHIQSTMETVFLTNDLVNSILDYLWGIDWSRWRRTSKYFNYLLDKDQCGPRALINPPHIGIHHYHQSVRVLKFHHQFRNLSVFTVLHKVHTILFDDCPIGSGESLKEFKSLAFLSVINSNDKLEFRTWSIAGHFYHHDTPSLRGLCMKNCNIPNATIFHRLRQLEVLDLSNNKQLSDIRRLRNCTSLKVLDLSGTLVRNLSPLRSCTNLVALSIAHTNVKDLTPLEALPRLRVVYSSYTVKIGLPFGTRFTRWMCTYVTENLLNGPEPLFNHFGILNELPGMRVCAESVRYAKLRNKSIQWGTNMSQY